MLIGLKLTHVWGLSPQAQSNLLRYMGTAGSSFPWGVPALAFEGSLRACTARVNEATGQKQTSGSSELKHTQSYTDYVGAAGLDRYEAFGAQPAHQHAEPTEIDFGPVPSDVWGLAGLDQVLRWAYPS